MAMLWCRFSYGLLPLQKSLAQRHVRKTDACQQGGLKLGPPVKQWSLYSLCDFTVECIRTKVAQSGAPVFILTPEVWVVPGGLLKQ